MIGKVSLGLLFVCTVGCAVAEDPAMGPQPTSSPPDMTMGSDPTTAPQTTGIDPSGDDGNTAGGEEGSTSTGMDADGTSTGARGESSSEGGEESSSGGSGSQCEPATTCAGADTIGGVAGDEPTPPVTDTGTEPVWLEIEISENDSGVFGNDMNVTVTLQSTGGDWDLRTYLGAPGGATGCGGEPQSSTTTGIDTVSYNWGEGGTANNSEDGTFLAVEIFPKDDLCVPGSSWSLVVTGDS